MKKLEFADTKCKNKFSTWQFLFVLLDDRLIFFDLRFETILLGGRDLRVFQLLRCNFDADFVAGDIGEDSDLTIACDEQLISERFESNRDDVVVENSFDCCVKFAGQS